MKQQVAKKVEKTVAPRKIQPPRTHVRKTAEKAAMTNYLLEQHPELGK